ncbi:hypothetical protein LI291_10805 [Intestinibacillus massiliensis]|nr:hypothetical protein [Intestinibacillus massiliensis]
MITNPKLPPRAGYVEIEVDGERRYRDVRTGEVLRLGEQPKPVTTEPQLLGQQITDEQLARIELGQRQTDIELSILGGTQHV